MITPFEIYVVLQLDSLSVGLTLISAVFLLWSVITALHAADNLAGERETAAYARARSRACVAALLFSLAVFVPSSKTAATMLILPAIANNETVQQEAGELYKMAKEALKEAIGP